jgi:hypothetical protein
MKIHHINHIKTLKMIKNKIQLNKKISVKYNLETNKLFNFL